MNTIITGSNGYLGQFLCNYLSETGIRVSALSRGENKNPKINSHHYFGVDLTIEKDVLRLVSSIQPEIIIHNAAMSKPDVCAANKSDCLLQNVTATKYLLEAASKNNTHFIYVSTDFVFGENGPHSEETIPNPLNFYGETKLMAEELVKSSGVYYTIMRPVFIYGPCYEGMRPTFLHWVKKSLENNKAIKVVDDQKRTPTYVIDICKGVHAMMAKQVTGSFHLAGKDVISPYEMALQVAYVLGLNASLIEPVNSDSFPEPVKRAKQSGLTSERAIIELGYTPIGFEEGVKLTFGL